MPMTLIDRKRNDDLLIDEIAELDFVLDCFDEVFDGRTERYKELRKKKLNNKMDRLTKLAIERKLV